MSMLRLLHRSHGQLWASSSDHHGAACWIPKVDGLSIAAMWILEGPNIYLFILQIQPYHTSSPDAKRKWRMLGSCSFIYSSWNCRSSSSTILCSSKNAISMILLNTVYTKNRGRSIRKWFTLHVAISSSRIFIIYQCKSFIDLPLPRGDFFPYGYFPSWYRRSAPHFCFS